MKKLLLATALAVVGLAGVALASDTYMFTLSSTNPTADTNNTSTEAITVGAPLAVQCDGTAHVRSSPSGTAATTNDVKVTADQLYDVDLAPTHNRLSVLAASGTVNCKVYSVIR